MTNLRAIAVIISALLIFTGCSASGASDLSSRTGIEYREEQINNLTGLNAVVYHSDECTLWVFGDDISAASINGSDFPSVAFSYKGQDVKTGKQVLMLADYSYSTCVEPTLNAIFERTISGSGEDESDYVTGDYEANSDDDTSSNDLDSGSSTSDASEEQAISDCGSGELELEVRRVGKTSTIEVVVVSISEIDCYVDLGPGETHLSISDGSSWLWSSDECLDKESGSNNVLLKAGQTIVSAAYEWDRSQSTGDGCSMADTGNEVLPTGLYYFKAELASLHMASSNKQFRF